MIYLLAVIGIIAVAALLWRAFGVDRIEVTSRPAQLAPDDDPDFLRKLTERQHKTRDDPDSR